MIIGIKFVRYQRPQKNMRHKTKTKRNLAVIIMLVAILGILMARGVHFFILQFQNSVWDGKTNLLIVVNSEKPFLACVNVFKKTIYLIEFPESAFLKYDFNSGQYDLKGILKIGRIDRQENEYLIKAASFYFGYPVVSYIQKADLTVGNFDIGFLDIFRERTNLTVFDYLKLKTASFALQRIDGARPQEYFQDLAIAKLRFDVKLQGSPEQEEKLKFYKQEIITFGWRLADVEMIERKKLKTQKCLFKNKSEFDGVISRYFDCQRVYDRNAPYDLVIMF